MNNFYVYAYLRSADSVTASADTPYYIGKGKDRRAWNKKHNVSLPCDKSKIVILKENLTDQDAKNLEIELIKLYGRKDIGTGILYNRTDGGEGNLGRIVTPEHKEKQSLALLGRISKLKGRTLTEEHKKKISLGNKGRISPNKGKTQSKDSNMKRSAAQAGVPKSKITCPHCNKTGGANVMPTYHFNNCKQKDNN